VEKVLRELIDDLRLAGHQHFAVDEYEDPHSNRLFAGANGSVSFQLGQIKIGICMVPVFIVLTAHFSRKEPRFDLYTVGILPDIVPYIVSDIVQECMSIEQYRM
jgi:hypothetical protein